MAILRSSATTPRNWKTVDPERLFYTLTGIVDGLLVAHCRFAIIEVTRDRYAQALVDINGRLQVEAVSNTNLLDNCSLTPAVPVSHHRHEREQHTAPLPG